MNIVIPDEYQDIVPRLDCYNLLESHDVTIYREPAPDFEMLVARLHPAEIVVSIRERVEFSRALIARLPNLKMIALVGRNATTIDYAAATEHGVMVSTGKSNAPVAPAELTVALMMAARRNIVLEAERMRRGEWPMTLSHRLRGSTLGIFGLGNIGSLVAEAGVGLGMKVWSGARRHLPNAPPNEVTAWPPARPRSSSNPTSCRCTSASAPIHAASWGRRTLPA